MTNPTTIEEVLVNFGNYIANDFEAEVGSSRHDAVKIKEALATIEQLVLGAIPDASIPYRNGQDAEAMFYKGFSYGYNSASIDIRQALTQLLRGGDK